MEDCVCVDMSAYSNDHTVLSRIFTLPPGPFVPHLRRAHNYIEILGLRVRRSDKTDDTLCVYRPCEPCNNCLCRHTHCNE
jgi:hypothetical protein